MVWADEQTLTCRVEGPEIERLLLPLLVLIGVVLLVRSFILLAESVHEETERARTPRKKVKA